MVGVMKTMSLLDRCLTEWPLSWRRFVKILEIQRLVLILLFDGYLAEAFHQSRFRMAPIVEEASGVGSNVRGTVAVEGVL
jgi:hypothetical protein